MSSPLSRPSYVPSVRRASTSVSKCASFIRPRLPVPDLQQTLKKYVQSLVPFLLEQEARGGTPFDIAFQKRLEWARDFEEGLGAQCQQRLLGVFSFCLLQAHIVTPHQ
jgi:Choline/Carnitine o-acyltransferase